MKLLSELLTLRESVMSERHQELQELIMSKFNLDDHDALDVLEFALGDTEWEDLSDKARKNLYAHYETTMPYGTAKARTGDPYKFIGKALEKDLDL